MVEGVDPAERKSVREALTRAAATEAELREVAAKLEEAQEIALFGNWEWVIARDSVSWSDGLYRIFGLEPGEFEATFEAYVERIAPEDRDWVSKRIAEALEAKQPYVLEHDILASDGSRRTLRCHGHPDCDDEGPVTRLVGVCQDITALAEAETARRRAEARFRNAFEHAPIGVALIDLADEAAMPMEVNRAMTAITGFEPQELLSMGLDAIISGPDRDDDRRRRAQLISGETDSYSAETRCIHAGGHQIWCQLSVSIAPGSDGEAPYGVLQMQDISERRRFEQRLRYLADHDSLTGLVNRRRFRSELEQHVAFSARYGGQGAVLIVDIDGFKEVNDSLGHQAGDSLLRQVATTLSERVRDTDLVARLSGDEFAVLMPQADEPGALQLGEDLRTEIAERTAAQAAQEQTGSVTVSVGIALFGGGHQTEAESALAAADLALYRAKEDGRDSVAMFEDPVDAAGRPHRPQTTSARIREALSEDRLSLYSQPIRNLGSGEVERHELLLRMTEKSGETIPAASFIRAAEKVGMVGELDRWVVGQALDLVAASDRKGDSIRVHVNLSGASVTDLGVLEFIERRLDEGDADPARLTFEITETAAIVNFDTAAVFADRLCEFGCEIAIDDCGAGFGPFQYFKRLPFDIIKIDGEFVRDLPRNDADQLTVQAMVLIAQGLGKLTIAEFVSDEKTATMLRAYGVDLAQGFHFGRPEPLDLPAS